MLKVILYSDASIFQMYRIYKIFVILHDFIYIILSKETIRILIT